MNLRGSRWIPIFGMFTKDINKINPKDETNNLIMVLYHGFIGFGGLIFLIGYIILNIKF